MHTDNGKTFDKRNIESNVRKGVLSRKDVEAYLAKLPDVTDKMFNPDEFSEEQERSDLGNDQEEASKKRGAKKKGKGQ